jgi:hypothetical protein
LFGSRADKLKMLGRQIGVTRQYRLVFGLMPKLPSVGSERQWPSSPHLPGARVFMQGTNEILASNSASSLRVYALLGHTRHTTETMCWQ